jgi:cytochrome c nitrite reductase small subunit
MPKSSSSGFFKGIINALPSKFIVPLFLLGGIAVGLGLYGISESRVFSYLSDDPSACVNCHVMAPSYQSWSKSSHARWATCNDCHVPHTSKLAGLAFEAQDGLRHSAIFMMNAEPPAPRPRTGAVAVIQGNCVRCHTKLTTEFVRAGRATPDDILHSRDKACWDCHRHVPHTRNSGLASAPNAIVPMPAASPVLDWFEDSRKTDTKK